MSSLMRRCLTTCVGCVLLMPAASRANEPAGLTPSPAVTMEPRKAAPDAAPLTLADCYALALKRSETIAINQELIKETEGRFLQALSGALPRVSFSSSDKRQDGSGGSAFTLRNVPERKFVFSQPLFSGFKEFAAMAGSRAERRQRIEEKRRAEHLLLIDVANAFYLLLEHREDLSALEAIRLALTQRLDELKERERLGRSRASEVASAEAQLRRVEAEMEGARSQEIVARQLVEFLTGLDRIEAITDSELSLPQLEDEAVYLAKTAGRPDVRAAEEASRIAEKEVTIAQAKFWPTVSADANYYIKRAGVAQDVNWDATLQVDVPIFQGGQTLGAVKEASARAREAKLQLSERQRRAALEIQEVYTDMQAALAKTSAFEKALDASEESYRLQVEDYQRNLVSTLDVLRELQALQDSRRDFIHATYDAKRLYWALRVATGETL